MAKILIVGCGAIGYELALKLARSGHEVTGLKRILPDVPSGAIKFFRADITSREDLIPLDTDFDHIFFIVSAGRRDEKCYRDIYQTGINNLIDKLSQAGSKAAWVFVSSTSVYGQNQGEWIDENSPASPDSVTSQIILDAEQALTTLSAANVIVRFSGIYGPGREYLIKMAKQSPLIQKFPPYYTNRIHQDDCVGILVFLLECRLKGIPLEQCYLASDDNPAPLWDVIDWMAKKLHCAPPVAKIVNQNIDMNKRCRNDKIKQLGYNFIYPDFVSGYSEIIL